jgi:hypothetical protein
VLALDEYRSGPVSRSVVDFMNPFRAAFTSLTVVALSAIGANAVCADSGPPQTLLEWSYGSKEDDGKTKLDEPLVTDRPDFTESPTTVGAGVIQLETGYTFTSDQSGGVQTRDHSFPEILLRVGVWEDWLEFRTEWNYEIDQTRSGGVSDTQSGANDMVFGFKIALTEQNCCLPETGIILELSVPTGADAFSSNEVQPGVNYCYSWAFCEVWSLSGSTAVNGAIDDVTNDTYTQFSDSLSLGHKWTENLSSFTEWYVLSPISADTNRPQYYLDGGFSYLVNNNVQWDIRAGVGLNEAADNFFAGSGLSIRYY